MNDTARAESGRPTLRAVLFDVDGTLYHQQPLRLLMTPDLVWTSLFDGGRTARALLAFRKAREQLRDRGVSSEPLERLQYSEPAQELGCDQAWLERIVAEWIMRRPLSRLRYCRRRGIDTFLDTLDERGIVTAVFSDYPTTDKLEALGLQGRFALEVCALDPDVNAFKPHPCGFLRACEKLGTPPETVLYIGDRPAIDGSGAAGAGLHAAIVDHRMGFQSIAREMFSHG
jgi:FMN phosphatase YigB (HAD superfamily)